MFNPETRQEVDPESWGEYMPGFREHYSNLLQQAGLPVSILNQQSSAPQSYNGPIQYSGASDFYNRFYGGNYGANKGMRYPAAYFNAQNDWTGRMEGNRLDGIGLEQSRDMATRQQYAAIDKMRPGSAYDWTAQLSPSVPQFRYGGYSATGVPLQGAQGMPGDWAGRGGQADDRPFMLKYMGY